MSIILSGNYDDDGFMQSSGKYGDEERHPSGCFCDACQGTRARLCDEDSKRRVSLPVVIPYTSVSTKERESLRELARRFVVERNAALKRAKRRVK